MIEGLIFDLDNCLASPRQLGDQFLQPFYDAVRKANNGTLTEAQLQAAFADCWKDAYDLVCKNHGFSKEMRDAGWEAHTRLEVQCEMQGYDDIRVLSDFDLKLFLVTSGFRRLQESKVKALKLDEVFTEVFVDAIDESDRMGKRGIFEKILTEHALDRDSVLVIGDNPESEIEAARNIGIRTVQTVRPGIEPSDKADFRIQSLRELREIIANLDKQG